MRPIALMLCMVCAFSAVNAGAQCIQAEQNPIVPCVDDDYIVGALRLQGMDITGYRLFQADGTNGEIWAGSAVASSYCSTAPSGPVRLLVDMTAPTPKWHWFDAGTQLPIYQTGDVVTPIDGNGHRYIAIVSGTGNGHPCSTSWKQPPFKTYSQGEAQEWADVTCLDPNPDLTWQEAGIDPHTRSWSPHVGTWLSKIVRPNSPNGHVYTVTRGWVRTNATEPDWSHNYPSWKDGAVTWGIDWSKYPPGENRLACLPFTETDGIGLTIGQSRRRHNGHAYYLLQISSSKTTSAPTYTSTANWPTSFHTQFWVSPTHSGDPWLLWAHDGIDASSVASWQANEYVERGDERIASTIPDGGANATVVLDISLETQAAEPTWSSSAHAKVYEDDNNNHHVVEWTEAGIDGADVDMRASKRIVLQNGFQACQGSYLHAYIVPRVSNPWLKEFTGTELDNSVWESVDGDPDEVTVANGFLELHAARKLNSTNDGRSWSRIQTKSANFGYGRYDIVASIPTGLGSRGAHWLYGTSSSTAPVPNHTNEIDIWERWEESTWPTDNCESMLAMTMHDYGVSELANQQLPNSVRIGYGGTAYTGVDLGDLHTYSLEWEPGMVRWLIDDRVIQRLPKLNDFNYPRHEFAAGYSHIILDNSSLGPYTVTDHCDPWNYSKRTWGAFSNVHKVQSVTYYATESAYKRADGEPMKPTTNVPTQGSLDLYPNPAKNEVSLRIAAEGSSCDVRLYDLLGREVKSIYTGLLNGNQVFTVNLNGLAAGTYYCVCTIDGAVGVLSRRLTIVR